MTDMLQMIDTAIADYSVSTDAMRWSPTIAPARTRSPRRPLPELTPEQRAQQREAVLAVFREAGAAAGVIIDELFRLATDVCRRMGAARSAYVDAGLLPPPVPVDPMQRALEARRNRNTGPAVPLRAPRRIDATRAR